MAPPPSVERALRTAARVDRHMDQQRKRAAGSAELSKSTMTFTSKRQSTPIRPTNGGQNAVRSKSRPMFTKNPKDDVLSATSKGVTTRSKPSRRKGKANSLSGGFSLYSTTESEMTDLPDYGSEPNAMPEVVEAESKLDQLAAMISSLGPGRGRVMDDNAGASYVETSSDTCTIQGEDSNRPVKLSSSRDQSKQQECASDRDTWLEELAASKMKDHVQKIEEAADRRMAAIEKREQKQRHHITTCLTTLHCLIAELKEIFALAGVSGPESESSASVSEQLFDDISRLLRALAFGADGTFEDGDCLAAATLLENRELRGKVAGKDREIIRYKSQIKKLSDVASSVADAESVIRKLDADHQATLNESVHLAQKTEELRQAHQADASKIAILENRDKEFAVQVHDWQALIDKAVVEAQLMQAHANDLKEKLILAEEETEASRRLASVHAQDAANLRMQIDICQRDIQRLESELETFKIENMLLKKQSTDTSRREQDANQITDICESIGNSFEVAPSLGHIDSLRESSFSNSGSWNNILDDLEADRASAREELCKIDGEINDLQSSLRELTSSFR